MMALEALLSLGQSGEISEHLSRRVRIANTIALFGAVLAIASVPFDIATAPRWLLLSDLWAFCGFASCWLFNATGHRDAARIVMLLNTNLVFLNASIQLGEHSDQRVLFFALSVAPFLVFDLDELRYLVPLVLLPIAAYFFTEIVSPPAAAGFSIRAYRAYSAVLAFCGLVVALVVFARVNRRAERSVAHKQRQLDEARARSVASARLAALGEMSGGVAHEIRNPLTALQLAAVQLAERPGNADQIASSAARIQRMGSRIAKILDGLLSFARDASADPFEVVPVERIVADTLELCRNRFVNHRIDLEVSPVQESLVVECRPVQIAHVLLNLLGNAHDAVETAPARWVRLDSRADGDWLELAVTDSGPGIPEKLRTRIFEPFFTMKPPDRGTGLGLSLSRGIVEAHHGTLELDEHAEHTRFVVRIPLTQPSESVAAPPPEPAPGQ